MFEVKDLELITEFLEKIRERNIEYEYEITAPVISSKNSFDSKEQRVKKDDTHTQKIEIILYNKSAINE